MRIALGSDHAGFNLKEMIKQRLPELLHEPKDYGTHSTEPADYPDYARQVGEAVVKGEADLGILICGSGIGMSIAANKVPGIRAALCVNEYMARVSKQHNDANVLCMGERVIGTDLAWSIVQAWLSAVFSDQQRHLRRVEEVAAIEHAFEEVQR